MKVKTIKNSMSARATSSGFTLVELLVVMAIMALLAGLVGPKVFSVLSKAKTKTVRIQIKDFESGLEMYKLDVGRFPNGEEGLQGLFKKPSGVKGWNGPYMKGKELPQDPWQNNFIYKSPGSESEFDIISYGLDGQEGGEGENQDVRSE